MLHLLAILSGDTLTWEATGKYFSSFYIFIFLFNYARDIRWLIM